MIAEQGTESKPPYPYQNEFPPLIHPRRSPSWVMVCWISTA